MKLFESRKKFFPKLLLGFLIVSAFLCGIMNIPKKPVSADEICTPLSDLTYTLFDDNNTIRIDGTTTTLTSIILPDSYSTDGKDYSVTIIGNGAFQNQTSLTSISLPDSLTTIEIMAFYNTGISSIILPSSITSIGGNAFNFCTHLTSINIENTSITAISSSTFSYCYLLSSITIPNTVTSIGDYAFQDCKALASLTVPDSVTSIGENAFALCEGLTSVNILGNNLTSIGDYAFGYCSKLTTINIPTSITAISDFAFYACDSLNNIVLPDTISSIGNQAFYGCSNLTYLVIPSSVMSIGDYALSCCGLTSIVIPSSVISIGENAFNRDASLESVSLPNSISEIKNNTFASCISLKYVNIPSSVTSIGEKAFYYCRSLASLTVPSSVTSIGPSAFSICNSLKTLRVESLTPPTLDSDDAIGFYTDAVVVPRQSLEAYKAADNWLTNADKLYADYYIIIYKDSNENVIHTSYIAYGESDNYITDHEISHYTFTGWDKDVTDVKSDITTSEVWSPDSYTITYNLNGGTNSTSNPSSYVYNSLTINLSDPAKEGYTFLGWYSDGAFENHAPSILIGSQGNKTFYAKWGINQYTISFNSNGGSEVSSISGNYGSDVTAPIDPAKEGYAFSGWYSDSDLSDSYTFSTIPSSSLTLYAKWSINEYTITYVLNEGTNNALNPSTYTVVSEDIDLSDPVKAGYTFIGWYSDSTLENPVSSIASGSVGNKTLYAKWNINEYIISFNSNGGSHIADISGNYGTEVSSPADPTRAGYTFFGWYSDSALTAAYTFSAIPSTDTFLYAKWDINQYTISFNTNGGSSIADITMDYNSSVSLPSNPTRDGYMFNGWSKAIPSLMPSENVTIEAYWLKYTTISEIGQATGLAGSVEGIANENAEISVVINTMDIKDVSKTEQALLETAAKDTLNTRKFSSLFLDINLILKEEEKGDEYLRESDSPLTFTITLPSECTGYDNYIVVSLHNGQTSIVDSQYNEEAGTITFSSDEFFSYAVIYTNNQTPVWLTILYIFIALVLSFTFIIGIFFVLYKKDKDTEEKFFPWLKKKFSFLKKKTHN
ncbi:MAG: leucine-rich repeat protein [Bacillales bacterium]|nr:leucine-rich repeat protein [Bacillales bacterium]